jgi:glycosyltransferase involved in cell wall biosynthesis
MSEPIVSVIVPTKNSANTLGECLESIKNQTYEPIELLVVDNFSNDTTAEIAKKYTSRFFSKGPERSPQRNYGVHKAKGKYVAIIDSDMNLSPDVVKQCVNLMEADTGLAGVVIPEESFGLGFWAQCKKLERSFYVGVPYMEAARFFRREDYIKLGGYDETMVSGEDWDLSQRIETLGSLGRIDGLIYHNEGRISLRKTVQKKFYYASMFTKYHSRNEQTPKVAQQTNVLGRYLLFLSHPIKLFRNPLLGLGMLFMKTCEFGFGAAGYLRAKVR